MNSQLIGRHFGRRLVWIVLVTCLMGSQTAPCQSLTVSSGDEIATDVVLTVEEFEAMDAAAWKLFLETYLARLKSDDPGLKANALQNLATALYTTEGKKCLSRCCKTFYDVYRHDSNENIRVMALQIITKTRNDAVMRLLADHQRWETSPRVRRLTNAALAQYYRQ